MPYRITSDTMDELLETLNAAAGSADGDPAKKEVAYLLHALIDNIDPALEAALDRPITVS